MLGRAKAERVVAGDVAEQIAGRVLALKAELVATCRRHATSQHGSVGGDDRASRSIEIALGLAVVARVGVELLLTADRQHVQLHEQHEITRQQRDGEAANLLVHAPAFTCRGRAAAVGRPRTAPGWSVRSGSHRDAELSSR